MGLAPKQYSQRDLTFSSTPAGWSLIRAVGQAYADLNGVWRFKFNIAATMTSAASGTATISGITFKNVANYTQPCAYIASGATILGRAYTNPGKGTLNMIWGTNNTGFIMSGDVELDGAPTW
jgi:hypothetical protein